jgi:hypothetical protein
MIKVKDTASFIAKSKIKHGDKFNYSKTIYTRAYDNVIIICPIHGEFTQVAHDHSSGYGCKKCGREGTNKWIEENITKTTKQFIKEAREIHKNKYDYSKVNYEKGTINVIIICNKCKNSFLQTPKKHLQGSGCGNCNRGNHSSISIHWLNTISEYHNINIQHAENGGEEHYQLENGSIIKFDGICHDQFIIFEFHGCSFHGCPDCFPNREGKNRLNKKTMNELYQKTIKRDEIIKNTVYYYIQIWECEYKELLKNKENLKKYLETIFDNLD